MGSSISWIVFLAAKIRRGRGGLLGDFQKEFFNGECGLMIDFVSFMQNLCCLYREYFIFLLTVI